MAKFNTVQERISWNNFTYNNKSYDLSHLDAHTAEFTDVNGKTYRYIITYSLHCFAKEISGTSQEENELLLYKTKKENRPFNFERYELSKNLKKIILSLGDKTTTCFHGGHNRFIRYEIKDSEGNVINYFIAFKSFKEKKKLRLHIESAYPVSPEKKVKLKKVNFFAIANNTLIGKKTKKPTP